MKKLLITGFDPFGGEIVNPAWEAVSRLPEIIGECHLFPLMIPTQFGHAFQAVWDKAAEIQPDIILAIGQAGGRKAVTPEMVAINWRYARIADNNGAMPQDEKIIPDGPDAYFATVPVRKMVNAIEQAGFPAAVSYSAGTFVCNEVMYSLLHHFRDTDVSAGFIHVPFLPEQAKDQHPSMALSDIVKALEAAVSAL